MVFILNFSSSGMWLWCLDLAGLGDLKPNFFSCPALTLSQQMHNIQGHWQHLCVYLSLYMAPMQPSFAIKCVKLLQQWFEEKQQQIETLDQQLKKLHLSMETLALQRKGWFFNGKMKKK